ncbi:MAG: amino acid adenylation domain-containing protein, partial [Pseudonocardiaceae bacterium]
TTPTEHLLTTLFTQLLHTPHIGTHDNFFHHGGHSLLAVHLVNAIRTTFGVELPLRAVFEAPTPAGLAARLPAASDARPALGRAARPECVPLSFAQRRLWFLNRMEGSSDTYNLPLAMRMSGELDRNALGAAVADLVRRHESLRTVFPVANGIARQQILDVEVELPVVDLTADHLASAFAAEVACGFDLTVEIPFRATLFALSPAEHVLLLVLHHIACDGSSFAPLARDLEAAYRARLVGRAPELVPLPVQYRDYALWQRELLGDENDETSVISRQLTFWLRELANLPEELTLPVDRQRPALPSYRGGVVSLDIGTEEHRCLLAVAKEHGVTPYMILNAGLAVLLTRLGAGTDIPIGSPVAGRTDAVLDDVVGFFVNTLVLRTDTSGDPSFAELLRRVRDTVLTAFAYQDLPFERLVEALNPVRTPSRSPLFQVLLALQNTEQPRLDLPGLTINDPGLRLDAAKFDLEFTFAEAFTGTGEPDGIRGSLRYSADLLDKKTASGMAARLARILTAVLADPAAPISSVDVLSLEEHAVVAGWCAQEQIPAQTVVELIEAQVRRAPDDSALSFVDEKLSYAGLNSRANRLAHRLVELGAGPETFVALALPRSPDLVVAVLAVLKAGAAYLPIDPDYPAERIRHMLADARPKLILTCREVDLPDVAAAYVLDDHTTAAWIDAAPDLDLADRTHPDHPVYLIYTSGSTGRPHGVVVSHRGTANLALRQIERFRVAPGARVLQFASPSFDAAFSELCMALVSGAELVLAPKDELTPGAPLAGVLRGVTHVTLPPVVLPSLPSAALDGMITLAVAGDAMPTDVVRCWGRGRRLINAYGPTEATVCATMSEPLAGEDRPTIGRPMAGIGVRVLDARLRPVPPGVPGELYLSGSGLARGYLGQTGLTASRFVADPSGAPGERMYRTGDLVRWDLDGNLHFAGRADHQVLVRGFRVEPAEIEAVLLSDPDVVQAAVVARDDRMLVGYVVLAAGALSGPEELRKHVASALPAHLVPSAVVVLDGFPVSPNGKLDRAALPAPTFTVGDDRARTPPEEVLRGLFAEVLGVPSVGVRDDFFALGGHSMLAATLISRVREVFGVELGLRTLFAASTVAELAAALDEASPGSDFAVLLPIRAGGDGPPLFCVHPASGLGWSFAGLTQHIDPAHPIYALQSLEAGASTVHGLAARYVDEIRRVAPHGPYHLVGWSVGGLIAHEIAVLLQSSGERVDLLAVLDSYPLADHPMEPPSADRAAEAVRREASAFQLDDRLVERLTSGYIANARAATEFRPGVFRGDLVHFCGTGGLPVTWSAHVDGEIQVHDVDSAHEEMTRPPALATIGEVLANQLRKIGEKNA